jgi:hypothetical protein
MTDRIYTDIDGYANAYGVLAGCFMNSFFDFLEKEGLINQSTAVYALVQSPAVYFYTKVPSFSYYDFYTWSPTSKGYSEHSFYANSTEFTESARSRNVALLTVTPDTAHELYVDRKGDDFLLYLNDNFVHLSDVGVFFIYLNNAIFEKKPELVKAKSIEILRDLTKTSFCPTSVIGRVLNFSLWYRASMSSTRMGAAEGTLNSQNRTFEMKDIDSRTFTILTQLKFKRLANHSPILSIRDFFNLKTGGAHDIYLEIPRTEQGYRYTRGVDFSPYLWQDLTVVFVYDSFNNRTETYFGDVTVSDSLQGIPDGTFSEVIRPPRFELFLPENDDLVQLKRIMIWNTALSSAELNTVLSGMSVADQVLDLRA